MIGVKIPNVLKVQIGETNHFTQLFVKRYLLDGYGISVILQQADFYIWVTVKFLYRFECLLAGPGLHMGF
jgi:hypothetical protein